MPEQEKMNSADIRSIAVYQKGILICILCNIGLIVGRMVSPPELQIMILAAYILLAVISTAFVFLLATKVSGTGMGIVLGILSLFPCIGLIVLLFINQKATGTLQKHGVRVGLLGASLSDLN